MPSKCTVRNAMPGCIHGGWALFRTGVISDGRYFGRALLRTGVISGFNDTVCKMEILVLQYSMIMISVQSF